MPGGAPNRLPGVRPPGDLGAPEGRTHGEECVAAAGTRNSGRRAARPRGSAKPHAQRPRTASRTSGRARCGPGAPWSRKPARARESGPPGPETRGPRCVRPLPSQHIPSSVASGGRARPGARGSRRVRHSPENREPEAKKCGSDEEGPGGRRRSASQQPFVRLRSGHRRAAVISVIQTARQWRGQTAGTRLLPPPPGAAGTAAPEEPAHAHAHGRAPAPT